MGYLFTFDWCGRMAHFRKFYANASALSHTIPPRTTVLGLLASIAELPRDSYYHGAEFAEFDSLRIGIQLISPVRKIMQKLNLLKFDENPTFEDFRGYGNRKQISTEFIVPQRFQERDAYVRYRIFVWIPESGFLYFKRLKDNLLRQYYPFGVCLGAANMLGFIESPVSDRPIAYESVIAKSDQPYHLHSAIEEDAVAEIIRSNDFSLEHDLHPTRFTLVKQKDKTSTRIAHETKVMLYAADGHPLQVKLKESTLLFSINNHNVIISLL